MRSESTCTWGVLRKRSAVLVAGLLIGALSDLSSMNSAAAAGPYGPDTCVKGYVWREATAADHTCVAPSVREYHRRQTNAAVSWAVPMPLVEAEGWFRG